jgi:hypothetical protein
MMLIDLSREELVILSQSCRVHASVIRQGLQESFEHIDRWDIALDEMWLSLVEQTDDKITGLINKYDKDNADEARTP